MMTPRIIAIAGVSSNSGKTTLLCNLLRELSRDDSWEAIKLTRGHYRSCGKDPHTCCVSHLLSEHPTVRSGREETCVPGKDTGRYWESGAANVHWVIVKDGQVEVGVNEALSRVKAPNVLIEGTSLLQFIKTDFAILVAGPNSPTPKASARRALIEQKINALYVSSENNQQTNIAELYAALSENSPAIDQDWLIKLPVFLPGDLPTLAALIKGKINHSKSGQKDLL